MRIKLVLIGLTVFSAVSAEEKPVEIRKARVEIKIEKVGTVEYTYDDFGQLIKKRVNPGTGDEAVWMYDYNKSGQLFTEWLPDGTQKLFDYETPQSKKPFQTKTMHGEDVIIEKVFDEPNAPEF